jgi:hypothetical protein
MATASEIQERMRRKQERHLARLTLRLAHGVADDMVDNDINVLGCSVERAMKGYGYYFQQALPLVTARLDNGMPHHLIRRSVVAEMSQV